MIDQAMENYREALRVGWRNVCEPRQPLEPIELADASRYLAAIAEGALIFVHADSSRPLFVPWVTADRRWADNGRDSAYWMAPVDGSRRYRISGVRRDECYLSFTVYAGSAGHPEQVALNVNHLGLGAANGERFELDIEPPADACYVIARQYFHDPANDRPAELTIEVTDGPLPTVPDEAELAQRWRTATGFVQAMTRPPATGTTPSYASVVPNRIGDPAGWRADEGGGRGTPDQTYALGRYHLGDDEALVMEVRVPPCTYTSAVLWNRFGQSIDWRLHRSVLNHTQFVTGEDGRARVVVAHRDPGVPNWLDAGGRPQGTVFWRFLLAEERPEPISSEVLAVDAVRAQD
ncbi:MAG: hypothetical protein KDB21_12525 [Acidimicrobiales bacterium]|nr:hypothetical protein [Acidimicrobiales bacterium]